MNDRGCSLHELQRTLPGPVNVRMTASSRTGQWIRALWRCGCRAEGMHIGDLLVIDHCLDHPATARLAAGAAR